MSSKLIAVALVALLAVVLYFSLSVNTVFVWINLAAIAVYVGLQAYRSVNPDVTSTISESKTVTVVEICSFILMVNLSILFFLKGAA